MSEKNEKNEIDQETVDRLRKSKEVVGPLRPCIIDQHGNVLSGKHRKEADPNWPEVVKQIDDEVDGLLVKIHDKVQRRVPMEETEKDLLELAELLEKRGVDPQKICAEVVKLVPYDDSYVRLLLPARFKRDYEQSRIFVNSHKHVNKHFDRVKESKLLAECLGGLEKAGKVRVKHTRLDREVEEMVEPSLPFPNCKCPTCEKLRNCYP